MSKPPAPSDIADKFMLRMPEGMRDRLKAAAERNKRSMNAEIVSRLTQSLEGEQTVTNIAMSVDQAVNLATAFKKAATFAEDIGGGIKFYFTVADIERARPSDESYEKALKLSKYPKKP